MLKFAKFGLSISGLAACAGAIVHIAINFGGLEWCPFFGAPPGLVDMARIDNLRAPLSCIAIAAFLAVVAAYAFSGARLIPRLPFLRLDLPPSPPCLFCLASCAFH